jgi:transposase
MQTQLPLFPSQTRLFNPTVGVFEQNNFVYYLHNGSPLFCHQVDDRNLFRFITANLVHIKLCTPTEIARVFGVSARSIQLNAKALRDKGSDWFIRRKETRGKCYKLNTHSIKEAQKMLDEGQTNSEIARQLGVSESAIRYHIRIGSLKKNQPNNK